MWIGVTLFSSPARTNASCIFVNISARRPGATAATAWRKSGRERLGRGISGSEWPGVCPIMALPPPSSRRLKSKLNAVRNIGPLNGVAWTYLSAARPAVDRYVLDRHVFKDGQDRDLVGDKPCERGGGQEGPAGV